MTNQTRVYKCLGAPDAGESVPAVSRPGESTDRSRDIEELLLLRGLPTDVAAAWQNRSRPGQDLLATLVDARTYESHGTPVHEAITWHRLGFGTKAGVLFSRAGWTPADALMATAYVSDMSKLEPWITSGLDAADAVRYVRAGMKPTELDGLNANPDSDALLDLLVELNSLDSAHQT